MVRLQVRPCAVRCGRVRSGAVSGAVLKSASNDPFSLLFLARTIPVRLRVVRVWNPGNYCSARTIPVLLSCRSILESSKPLFSPDDTGAHRRVRRKTK